MKLLWTLPLLLDLVTASLHIESTDIAPPASILGEHQELAKTWTISSDDVLEKLHIAVAGPVIIRYDPTLRGDHHGHHHEGGAETEPKTNKEASSGSGSGPEAVVLPPFVISPLPSGSSLGSNAGPNANATARRSLEALPSAPKEDIVAKILVSGNGTELLSAVEVEELNKDRSNGLRVHLRNADTICDGYLLTQILLAEPNQLHHLVTSVSTSVVAEDGVLLSQSHHSRVRLSTNGDGVLLVTSEHPIELGHLDVDVTGKGVLQIHAPTLNLSSKLAPSIAGSGVIAVHTDSLRAEEMETTLSGSGAMYLEAKHLDVDRLTTSVYGTANASFHVTESGAAQEQKISVAGAGAVYAGSVIANQTKVSIRGAAEVYVQVTDKLRVDASFSGDVFYVGKTPAVVKTSSWFWRTPVHAATTDKVLTHELVATPKDVPDYVSIRTKHSLFSADPIVKHVSAEEPLLQAVNLQAKVPLPVSHVASFGMLTGLMLMLGCVGVGVTWSTWRQRWARRLYQPLV